MIRIALIAFALFGCKIKNELSCENPDVAAMPHCRSDGGGDTCTEPGPCPGGGVCDVDQGVCVECVSNAECSGTTPTCNLTSNTCEACAAHPDCASEVCNLADGSCVDEENIAYVDGGGSGSECTKDTPCATLNAGIAALSSGSGTKNVIKLTGDVIDNAIGDSNGRDFTIFAAPGATLKSSIPGSILSVNSGSKVTIFDLEIVGGLANSSGLQLSDAGSTLTLERVLMHGHENTAIVTAGMPAKLTMRRCIISANDGGGVNAQDLVVDMTNNLFVRNGSGSSNVGGLTLGANNGSTFQFNTVADNVAISAATSGVNCVLPFPAANNIVTNNGLDATCTFSFSLFTAAIPANGTMNRAGNPMFANNIPTDPRAANYYRLLPGSDAIDRADPAATLDVDIDGQTRPNGTVRDMGADELGP